MLFVTSEMSDFVQVGGLGAVSASLPRALKRFCDMRVLLPGYKEVLAQARGLKVVAQLPGLAAIPPCAIAELELDDGLKAYVALCAELYEREGFPYGDAAGIDFTDNDVRFARLSLAAAQMAGRATDGWRPDVLHLNDWQSGLAAGYLAWSGQKTPSVMTVHNLAHHGLFPAERLAALAIPESAFTMQGVEFFGKISFLKAGLNFAAHLTTVSEAYAAEITRPESGCGLDGVLAQRAAQGGLTGILNGIDDTWDPRKDQRCPYHYDLGRWKGRYGDFIRGVFGLKLARAPLFSVVSRLVHQKGADLVLEAAEKIVARGGLLVVTGRGEARYESAFLDLARRHPQAVGVRIGFDPEEGRAIFAGSDFVLMPSRFEPCGLSQMYAQRFGAIPVAHRTGGLSETVEDGKTGFLFDAPTAGAFAQAIDRAFEAYGSTQRLSEMRRAASARKFDWAHSAQRYGGLYRSLVTPSAGDSLETPRAI